MTDDPSHGWNHPQCDRCWYAEYKDSRLPVRLAEGYREAVRCCFCGNETSSGIYRRVRPAADEVPYCPSRQAVLRTSDPADQ